LQAWRQYVLRMARLRFILQKVLGRYLELGFAGWQ
jgi:hypothetical protein